MPVHDWTRVDAGTFHSFHLSWLAHLMGVLNRGLLPPDYYAMAEQVATAEEVAAHMNADLLTLHAGSRSRPAAAVTRNGGVAVAEVPPRVRLTLQPNPDRPPRRSLVRRRRHLVVRHVTGDRIVAVVEVVSPANKDRRESVRELAEKIVRSLEADIQVLLLDLFPPTRRDPRGIHGAVWSYYDATPYRPPADAPLTLASYVWQGEEPKAFLESVAVGQPLIDMPLFLNRERYVNVPLEQTYLAAYDDMPQQWRRVLEGAEPRRGRRK